MSSSAYQLQILEKSDYSKQHIVPFDGPLPPLADSSIRVKSDIVALTTNNISYARLGEPSGLNIYATHPIPFKNGPYADSSKYARISAWGIATVIESTVDFVQAGARIWGFLPLATLPVDKVIEKTDVEGVLNETTSYRQALLPVYNRYFVLDASHAENEKFQAYSALMKVLFETSYSLNRVSFAWAHDHPANPLGLRPPPPLDTWTKEHADLRDSTVFIMPASSKTAFAFAYMLRFIRPEGERPRAIVGVSSAASRPFCEDTKLYDHVALYQDAESEPSALAEKLGVSQSKKVVLVDFGARGGFKDLWRSSLEAVAGSVLFVRVGGSIPEKIDPEEDQKRRQQEFASFKANSYPANASGLREAGMHMYGEAEYLADIDQAFDAFLQSESADALKPIWGQGLDGPDGVEGGWSRLCAGDVGAAEGLVYRL